MFFSQTLIEKCVPNRPRKGNIHDPALVNVPDLGASEPELPFQPSQMQGQQIATTAA
jgi:hypothetical protein